MTVAFSNMELQPINRSHKTEAKEFIIIPKKDNLKNVTFVNSMRITLLIGQLFGLNPVSGISEDDTSKLRFTYYTGRFLYCMVTVIVQGLVVFCFLIKVGQDNSNFSEKSSGINFYVSTWIESILFLRLAKKWPKLCRQISNIESVDPITDKYLVWKCNITCVGILVIAAMEHAFFMVLELSRSIACKPDQNSFEVYIQRGFNWIWDHIPYNIISAALLKFSNIQSTFNWTYSGIFIMCICWYLTARFQQINDRIYAVRGQNVPPTFWRTVREDYTEATTLVRQVDEIINSITLVSFGSNLYSICLLILHSLEDGLRMPVYCGVLPKDRLLKGYEYVTYYVFSIGFLLVRSLAVSLIAARVNTTSSVTAVALYDVPSESFDGEVQRLLDQVHGDSVALTGLRLFNIKRDIVLTIAASVVTYELVLIQFNNDKK